MSRMWIPTPASGSCYGCGASPCAGAEDICNVNLRAMGGDEGFSRVYPSPTMIAAGGSLHVYFNAASIPDRLLLIGTLGVLYDSGYIGSFANGQQSVDVVVVVPPGTISIRVEVNVHPAWSGTGWRLQIECIEPTP